MTRTDDTLRALDPAGATTLTAAERERAEATLTRILATPSRPTSATGARRHRPRTARVLVAAALVLAAVVAVPALWRGGPAFASWSPTPTTLSPAAAAEAATTCRAGMEVDVDLPRVAVSERRGGWTYVLLTGDGGEAACLLPDDAVGTDVARLRENGFFGSATADPPAPPATGRDGLVETESAVGSVRLPGRGWFGTARGWFTWTSGYAGADVTAVTVHPPVGPAVEASLVDGRFSAWWPTPVPSSDHPEAGGAWTFTVTLTDGTTRRVDGQD